jgi:hypothetical protein
MSLFNPKNLLVPFQSRFNVGLMIVAAVLVAAIRLAGGGVSIEEDTPRARNRASASDDSAARARLGQETTRERPARSSSQQVSGDRDQLLDDLLSGEGDLPASRKRDVRQPQGKQANEFGDIRKSLGLE